MLSSLSALRLFGGVPSVSAGAAADFTEWRLAFLVDGETGRFERVEICVRPRGQPDSLNAIDMGGWPHARISCNA